MSRKLDWADKEARRMAVALDITNETAIALLAAELRLARQLGISEGIDKADAAVDAAFKKRGETNE